VSTTREQVLSEFIDAWNAGKRPDVDDYIARVAEQEQGELADELLAFLTLAPTPDYSDEALAAIRAEPAFVAATEAAAESGGVLGSLLARLRERAGLTTTDVAAELVGELGLRSEQAPKTARYLERLEEGSLEPGRVSRRVFDALGKLLRAATAELEGAADRTAWAAAATPAAAPVFRADEDAAASAGRHLEVLADALAAPGGESRDEVDELFLGGR